MEKGGGGTFIRYLLLFPMYIQSDVLEVLYVCIYKYCNWNNYNTSGNGIIAHAL